MKTQVGVRFRDKYEKSYSNKTFTFNSYINLEIYDYVIVETQYGFSLAKVFKIYNDDIERTATKNVICKCDVEQGLNQNCRYDFEEEAKKQLAEKRAKRIKELKSILDRRLNEVTWINLLAADPDPLIRQALEEYVILIGE